jgi:hypothetical protein
VKKYLLALAVLPTLVGAQAPAWNVNPIQWTAPTQCVDGTPITNCPVASYQIERSDTPTGTYVLAGTSTTTSFTHTVTVGGQSCYRVRAVATHGTSDLSLPPYCKTNTAPPPPVPNPPTDVRVRTLTVMTINGQGVAPVFAVLGDTPATFRVAEFYGVVPAGRPCGDFLKEFRGQRLHRVIPQAGETWGDFGSRPLAAPCGPSA